jgi:hypothetical protein
VAGEKPLNINNLSTPSAKTAFLGLKPYLAGVGRARALLALYYYFPSSNRKRVVSMVLGGQTPAA